ncbi:FRG domain-containing protein [Hirschia baltica]|uniref:FRG domain protein n=1 Tax=Hirschia baltica (strain ATCC 49814 / DSM 5838 / IFAM 1418) TaxID=582402 RepID=C6XL84_HIRBI|nr:FRG domain-containing protein [Hirschia baltica]ACT59683.1 FRG domain protein [Hirschia baltica ATCC 49814]
MRTHRDRSSESANAFLSSLMAFQTNWQLPRKQIFVWRGVGDAMKHSLVPTALRPENAERLLKLADLHENSIYCGLNENLKQVYLEFRIVERFLAIADRAGLAVPELPVFFREAFNEFGNAERNDQFQEVVQNWPPQELVPIIALAQHYGLPTRLLDWSYDVLTAAYFAAESALALMRDDPSKDPSKHTLGVWMMNPYDVKEAVLLEEDTNKDLLRVEVSSPPKYQNPNLMAQAGLFTWVSGKWAQQKLVVSRPLDELANPIIKDRSPTNRKVGTFILYELPWTEADELLSKLFNLGVSKAKLEPGFGGVARTMEQLAYLEWKPTS